MTLYHVSLGRLIPRPVVVPTGYIRSINAATVAPAGMIMFENFKSSQHLISVGGTSHRFNKV